MQITLEFLRWHDACSSQRALFAQTFPAGAQTTRENLMRAADAGLDIAWLDRFVSPSTRRAYDAAVGPALAEYLP